MSYTEELHQLLDNAILKMKTQHSDFVIYTANIWTDSDAQISAINFDSKKNSLKKVREKNKYDRKQYESFLAEGDLTMANLFLPDESLTRCTNPADFELSMFAEIKHQAPLKNWHSTLKKFAKFAFEKIQTQLIIDKQDFELAINSSKDWYKPIWHI